MANHPNRSNMRYFKVSPRGFANEVIYFRVPSEKVEEVNKVFESYEDDVERGGYCNWTSEAKARMPGVAVDWEDRAYFGY